MTTRHSRGDAKSYFNRFRRAGFDEAVARIHVDNTAVSSATNKRTDACNLEYSEVSESEHAPGRVIFAIR